MQQIQKQVYSFGLAEFNIFAAPFAVFDALGIENTFDVSCSIFYPQYLQFLDDADGNSIDVTQYEVPELNTAEPGDWEEETEEGEKIWKESRKVLNIRNHLIKNINTQLFFIESNSLYNELYDKNEIYVIKSKQMYELFRNIKIHFTNQHINGIFKTFPVHEKIGYIGGIHVEEKNILTDINKKQNHKKVKQNLKNFRKECGRFLGI
uniref:Glucuronosyltransferase n=1 Tax=Meloidogyne hapla TaxID=6305 RepID=A0A1I8BBP9_MELHA